MILADGQELALQDMSAVASVSGNELWTVERMEVCAAGHTAFATYWATDDEGGVTHCTAVLQRESSAAFGWMVMHAQKSASRPFSSAPPPYYA